jgi:hypothetical protein
MTRAKFGWLADIDELRAGFDTRLRLLRDHFDDAGWGQESAKEEEQDRCSEEAESNGEHGRVEKRHEKLRG